MDTSKLAKFLVDETTHLQPRVYHQLFQLDFVGRVRYHYFPPTQPVRIVVGVNPKADTDECCSKILQVLSAIDPDFTRDEFMKHVRIDAMERYDWLWWVEDRSLYHQVVYYLGPSYENNEDFRPDNFVDELFLECYVLGEKKNRVIDLEVVINKLLHTNINLDVLIHQYGRFIAQADHCDDCCGGERKFTKVVKNGGTIVRQLKYTKKDMKNIIEYSLEWIQENMGISDFPDYEIAIRRELSAVLIDDLTNFVIEYLKRPS